jgi:hypothetical protein
LAEVNYQLGAINKHRFVNVTDPSLLPVRGQPFSASTHPFEQPQALWTPLYPQAGGPAQGFKCNIATDTPTEMTVLYLNACGRVTRTERGMKSHLWSVHKVKRQGELFHD